MADVTLIVQFAVPDVMAFVSMFRYSTVTWTVTVPSPAPVTRMACRPDWPLVSEGLAMLTEPVPPGTTAAEQLSRLLLRSRSLFVLSLHVTEIFFTSK